MFIREEASLPADPVFPQTLEENGFFINDENFIRRVEDPEAGHKFRSSVNQRYNSLFDQNLKDVVMNEVTKRLEKVGVTKLYVPHMTTKKPAGSNPQLGDQCIPILTTNPEKLKNKQRIVLVIPQSDGDLECFHWGGMFRDGGLEEASPLAYARELDTDSDSPGFVVANCQQLLFSFERNTALTQDGWQNRQRRSMIHHSHFVLESNQIKGHATPEEHIKWVFNEFLWDERFISPTATFDIIANRQACEFVLTYLNSNIQKLQPRISAIALIYPLYEVPAITNQKLRDFLAKQARSWIRSQDPTNTPIQDENAFANGGSLCPTFSGGNSEFVGMIITHARRSILAFFREVRSDPNFVNPEFVYAVRDDQNKPTGEVRKVGFAAV